MRKIKLINTNGIKRKFACEPGAHERTAFATEFFSVSIYKLWLFFKDMLNDK